MITINGIAIYRDYSTGVLKAVSNARIFIKSQSFIDFGNFDEATITDERGNFTLKAPSDTCFLHGYYDEGFLIYQGGSVITIRERTNFRLVLGFPRKVIF